MTWQGEIDHSSFKKRLLEQWRAGEISQKPLYDADTWLIAAAHFHGRKPQEECPTYHKFDLRPIFWVLGKGLGRRSGSACTENELSAAVDKYDSYTVKEVEVYLNCKWNFLTRTLQVIREESENQGEHS